MNKENKDLVSFLMICFLGFVFIIGFIWGVFALASEYSVWESSKSGEATLKKAEWTRQVAVKEAQAKFDSAELLAKSEIARAKGVAEANKIIGESLKENEAYLRYFWIDSLQHTKDKIVYVATEAGLPILESGKR